MGDTVGQRSIHPHVSLARWLALFCGGVRANSALVPPHVVSGLLPRLRLSVTVQAWMPGRHEAGGQLGEEGGRVEKSGHFGVGPVMLDLLCGEFWSCLSFVSGGTDFYH